MTRRAAQDVLDFDALLALLRAYSTCAPGRRHLSALAPQHNRAALDDAFALIREAAAWLRAGHEMGFGALADPEEWLARIRLPASVLTAQEILDAASLLDTVAWLRKSFREDAAKFPLLAARAAMLADFRSLTAAIRKAILPNGDIADDASSELKRIRGAIARTRDTVQKQLRAILRSRVSQSDDAGDDYVTIRNDRFVIPVRAADRRAVPGVVHGSSATGQTIFVEPLETLELNNQLVQLAEDEAAEIARILSELTDSLRAQLAPLAFAADTIAELDSTFARARFAREFNATFPSFTDSAAIQLDSARHPILEARLRAEGREIVPISLALGGSSKESESVLVISGPNTGGKTVALKTVGLAALAAQSGVPVAAERAELPLFDRVLVDIGDEQSIAADLSTFSAHIMNLHSMLEAATPRSLVLVDEMGTGTAPEEGSALAVALLEEFRSRGCLTLATTHHDKLKTYATSTPGILNAAVDFDAVNLRPTYRLLVGFPGVSSGIHIAERLGLPPQIIDRAKSELAPDVREAASLIAWLHRSRDELEAMKRDAAAELARLEEERRKLQTEWAERQRARLAELEKKFVATLKQYEEQIRQLVAEVKDRELRAQLEKQAARRTAKAKSEAREQVNATVLEHLAESQRELGPAASSGVPVEVPVAPDALAVGARVRVRGFQQPVIVKRLDGRAAEIQAGPLRMKVRIEDITAIVSDDASASARRGVLPYAPAGSAHGPAPTPPSRGVTVHSDARDLSRLVRGGESARLRDVAEPAAPDEINVIGMTVEQASEVVDKFLDDAALAAKPRVRIIHGHGTGALRRGLAEFLKTHPLVERISNEMPERGGAAITLVDLKV
jgi:DNA mismatch repair protein MutS2